MIIIKMAYAERACVMVLRSKITTGLISKDEITTMFNNAIDNTPGDYLCWKLKSGLLDKYGHINILGAPIGLHVLSYLIYNDWAQISEEHIVGHKCDKKHCTNPHHLELITHSQNMRDAYARGLHSEHIASDRKEPTHKRGVACTECRKSTHNKCVMDGDTCTRCKRLGLNCVIEKSIIKHGFTTTKTSGEKNVKSKLTDEKFKELVEEINKGYKHGDSVKLSEKYGVSTSYISSIVTGKCTRKVVNAGAGREDT